MNKDLRVDAQTSGKQVEEALRGSPRYRDVAAAATHAMLEGPAVTDPKLRWAVVHNHMDEVPAELRSYLQKVRSHAYRVTDEDIQALKNAGYDEDRIFELTVCAAFGAALLRLERGLIAHNEEQESRR